jgi:hypothetical protein
VLCGDSQCASGAAGTSALVWETRGRRLNPLTPINQIKDLAESVFFSNLSKRH